AKPLGGWEAPDVELRGHAVGHYLSALALMYAATGDARFKSRADVMVAELAKVQGAEAKKFHPGYLSAFPEEVFDPGEARQRGGACGRPTTRSTRSWPACWTCISCAATSRRSTSARRWPTGRSTASITSPRRSSRRRWAPSTAA